MGRGYTGEGRSRKDAGRSERNGNPQNNFQTTREGSGKGKRIRDFLQRERRHSGNGIPAKGQMKKWSVFAFWGRGHGWG